ncbi:Putative metabolite transport protein NicT [Paraburkholderia hiiakae]|uniref:Metabolite transport protein NicT n=1 Tax=Paraburkholderia hiiakae TaxID=1081782 RepID=A0ABM8NTT1_9BURK|nr:MFS transporter [Paraburkholderia hiiakae]CAD6543110.1 Putative metabolite transport protein NicT [Paraburkholderia hiiakae]
MATPTGPLSIPVSSAAAISEQATYRKVAWRLTPLLLLCYVVAYLDRVNVGFAKLQMAADLQLSDAVYGFGAGVFFLGYFLFEVPSNLILHRVGARVWIARIMITWGLVSMLTMFVRTPGMFFLMRFLLGVAEAGFFPGVILYLTYWYPASRRGMTTAWLVTAVALSGLIGGPLSGWLLTALDGVNQWHGWQWLFLVEGLPSVLIGLLVLGKLDERIETARWLSDEEKLLLLDNLRADAEAKTQTSVRMVFTNPRVWLISLIHFLFVMGLYGVGFWLPTLIKGTGVADALTIGLLSAIPFGAAVVVMLAAAKHADIRRERRRHVAGSALAGALGLLLAVLWADHTALAMCALTLATAGIITTLPLFWCLPTAFLGGAAAAAGIAFINAIGNLAGFLGPYAVGWLKEATHSSAPAMYLLAACMALGAVLALALPARLVDR